MDNPYIPIDEEFGREVAVAQKRHEEDAAPLNVQLQENLAKCKTQAQRDVCMAEFAEIIAPVQATYELVIGKARAKMEAAKKRAEPEYLKIVKTEEGRREKKAARHRHLRDKLLEGKATPVEVQEALGLTLETMVGESTTEGKK